jgi:DNA-binding NarL/FixJ family response regulator
MSTIRILIADDHAVVRHGLRLLIDSQPDMTVIGDAADGAALLEHARVLAPDVVILDISMPRMNGLVTTRALRDTQPGVRVVILTRHEEETHLEEMLRAGRQDMF